MSKSMIPQNTNALTSDEKYKRTLDLYKEYRARLVAEQSYYFQRFAALLACQAFLFAAYGMILTNAERLNGLEIYLPTAITLAALTIIGISITTQCGFNEARRRLINDYRGCAGPEREEDLEATGSTYRLPPLILDDHIRKKGDSIKYIQWLLCAIWVDFLFISINRAFFQ